MSPSTFRKSSAFGGLPFNKSSGITTMMITEYSSINHEGIEKEGPRDGTFTLTPDQINLMKSQRTQSTN